MEGFIYAVGSALTNKQMTRNQLAEKCGYPLLTINRMMEGNFELRLDMAANVAAVLGLSLDDICGLII